MRRIVGVELSKRSLKTGTSTIEKVAGATSVYYPMSTLCRIPGEGLTAGPPLSLQRLPISFPATTSKKEFERAPVDLNEAAREVIALSLTDLQRNRVILRTECFQPFYQQEATA